MGEHVCRNQLTAVVWPPQRQCAGAPDASLVLPTGMTSLVGILLSDLYQNQEGRSGKMLSADAEAAPLQCTILKPPLQFDKAILVTF